MEHILAVVEGTSTSEITTFDQVDQNLCKEFLTKTCVWDYLSGFSVLDIESD